MNAAHMQGPASFCDFPDHQQGRPCHTAWQPSTRPVMRAQHTHAAVPAPVQAPPQLPPATQPAPGQSWGWDCTHVACLHGRWTQPGARRGSGPGGGPAAEQGLAEEPRAQEGGQLMMTRASCTQGFASLSSSLDWGLGAQESAHIPRLRGLSAAGSSSTAAPSGLQLLSVQASGDPSGCGPPRPWPGRPGRPSACAQQRPRACAPVLSSAQPLPRPTGAPCCIPPSSASGPRGGCCGLFCLFFVLGLVHLTPPTRPVQEADPRLASLHAHCQEAVVLEAAQFTSSLVTGVAALATVL